MIILCIILTLMALTYGFFHADFFNWGIELLSLGQPYFRLGLSFEPQQFIDGKGDQYAIRKLNIGFIIINLYISFYTYMGTTPNQTTNDITTESPIATI